MQRGHDRKPDDLAHNPQASSSSYRRVTPSLPQYAAHSYAPQPVQRDPSPPASAYWSTFDHAGPRTELQATPDANAHFAYSTTLRRHTDDGLSGSGSMGSLPSLERISSVVYAEGASGLWSRLKRAVGADKSDAYERLETRENGHAPGAAEPKRDTPSALFAHYTIDDTVAHFHTSPTDGLTAATVPAILARVGYNEFSVSTPEPLLIKFAKTIYESPLILLLCGSAAISGLMGNVDDAVSITVAVLIVLTVGFVQERRSEQSLEALNKLVPHHCHTIRDGRPLHLLANEIVPGDLVTFTTGDRIPADVRITDAIDLEVDESSLTGETTARSKDAEPCRGSQSTQEPVALADRTCIAYMGTLVRNGRGSGIVIATGTETEFGVIFSMMQEVEEKRTPLQLSMDELAKKLSMISFGIIGVIVLIGVLQRRSWLDMFTIGVSLAVAAIPEGLPIVTTVTLALGVLRMAKRKAIVKKLHSVEALGSVSVVCSDKTGTLTKNEQTVVEMYAVDETVRVDPSGPVPHPQAQRLSSALAKTLHIGAVCNNAARNEQGEAVGQATDVALLNVLNSFELTDPRTNFTRTTERPFNSEQKFMAVSGYHGPAPADPAIQRARETYYIKGSIDAVLGRCKYYHVSDDSTPLLDPNTRSGILSRAQATAARGLRVLAMAYSSDSPPSDAASSSLRALVTASAPTSRSATPSADRDRQDLTFAGFEAMLDPPRRGVADAVGLLQTGGVQVVMITGDAEETALAIARDLGLRLPSSSRSANRYPPSAVGNGSAGGAATISGGAGTAGCLTGSQIERMTKAQLKELVGGISVFARTTPKHKMAIVDAFQSRGAVVAMTGDGVNDAPALKMADIGISMGKSGTDVAKEAADMILVDDNFSTILPAVEEGKSIFHNIQNFLSFQLSTAAAALTLITMSTMFGLSNPLNAMQILFINILMDGPPSQSLGVDPVDPTVMKKPPRRKNEPIISKRLLYRVLFSASIIVVGTLFIYTYALSDDHMSRREQTMTFTCFVFLDLVSAIQNRGLGCALSRNRMLLTTVSISFCAQLALVYVPMMQAVFQTEALSGADLRTLLALAGVSFALHEARRRYERKLEREGTWAGVVEEMA